MTPKRLRAVYTLLQQAPPFDRWGLPPPTEVKFEVLSDEDHGEYSVDWDDRHYIAINADTHLTLHQVLESVAHEMIHLRQQMLGRFPGQKDAHNAEFRRLRRVVCRALGFDVQRF